MSIWVIVAIAATSLQNSGSIGSTFVHGIVAPSPILRHRGKLGRCPPMAGAFDIRVGSNISHAASLKGELTEKDISAASTLAEVDVRHKIRTSLIYDDRLGRYVYASECLSDGNEPGEVAVAASSPLIRLLTSSFIPEGVIPSYYTFIRWRIAQRYINAIVHVFGTQSLLLGLGIKNQNSLGLGAALNWVLKDALGKIVRMVWASKMGRKFDPDAKRWRFRSSLVFAAGNGLEVLTFVFPQLFLLWATLANSFKQMSMLTSSATRNALYNSFGDGARENIGDITAKGEAQIAVVDLFGIATGVFLSRAIGVSVRSVLSMWVFLQIGEIFCMYHEIRSVVFRKLNFERLWNVVNVFLESVEEIPNAGRTSAGSISVNDLAIPTPDEMAHHEKIFLPPNHLARRAIAFGSLGRAKLTPNELITLMDIFRKEKFLLVVGEDVKNNRSTKKWWRRKSNMRQAQLNAKANCHIVLHKDANNVDIVKSSFALEILRKKLAKAVTISSSGEIRSPTRSRDCTKLIRETRSEADKMFPMFLNVLSSRGWVTPARYMFGRVTMRADWPIKKSGDQNEEVVEKKKELVLVHEIGTTPSQEGSS